MILLFFYDMKSIITHIYILLFNYKDPLATKLKSRKNYRFIIIKQISKLRYRKKEKRKKEKKKKKKKDLWYLPSNNNLCDRRFEFPDLNLK